MRSIARWTTLAVIAGSLSIIGVSATAGPKACDKRNNDTTAKLLECVTAEGVREHQAAFQAIADANGGTRASGTPGYDASADYVAERMTAAGYTVTRQPFDFAFCEEQSAPTFRRESPNPRTYEDQVDFDVMQCSGPADNLTADIKPVDVLMPPTGGSTSGCEDSDFAGFVPGDIALLQRGTCTFNAKAVNAEEAGASGAIIYNEGNTPDRQGVVFGTLGTPVGIPVVGISFADGEELFNLYNSNPPVTMFMDFDTIAEIRSTENVFAESRFGNDSNVVMAGAHLDSVPAGPGINDNGSGSAALIEVAELLRKLEPNNTLRFAWWGAEESNLVGSTFYVNNASEEELENIALYLNFDMIGSPNFVRFVYDGDGSDTPAAGPAGSEDIEALFLDYFDSQGLATEPTAFDGRSDYGPFIAVGIPAGGLFSGAEGIKTAEQQATYGGTAGDQYDPCYHQACDTFANNSNTVLGQFSDAAAFAILTYSNDTSSVG
jgi:Zn-dependent M28 family amino/carboxypeptidase